MAQYKVCDPEEMVECPYDKVHMIAAKRMQYHLMKCRRNHPGADFAVCPYNARHEVRKPELRYHMVNCPDKARLEPSILYEQNKENRDGQYLKGNTDLPRYADSSDFVSVENWDEEIPSVARVGVDPNYFMRLNARNTAGMSRKEKKVYMSQVSLPAEERYVPDPEEEDEQEEQKLRLPHAKPETFMSFPSKAATHVGQIPPSTSVLALSLSRSGVGRGQMGGRGVPQVTPQGPRPIGRGQPGLGRSAGRGLTSRVPPGYTTINTNTNSILTEQPGQFSGETGQSVLRPGQLSAENGQSVLQPGQLSRGSGETVLRPGQLPGQLAGVNGQPAGLRLPNTMMPTVFSMGLGRGSGRGSIMTQNGTSPSFVIPNVKGLSQDGPVALSSGSETDDGSLSSSSTLSDVEKKKEKRRLEKKLRQIELLESKVDEGYTLTSEEEIKCEKKDEILEAIQNLKI
ncbi:uncharacterized protein LOC117316189 [Pecten maximus]|uniref:uncharacterized protein LOC117316189 n=1 Tax=Pecten maximus TaxID=6579 RepID=UPI001458D83F|nr:uncharacterized protein LOC117316189 [Pecten maximus]